MPAPIPHCHVSAEVPLQAAVAMAEQRPDPGRHQRCAELQAQAEGERDSVMHNS